MKKLALLVVLVLAGCYSPMKHDITGKTPVCGSSCLEKNAACFAQASRGLGFQGLAAQEACDRATSACIAACPVK